MCGLKSLIFVDSKVRTVRMLQVNLAAQKHNALLARDQPIWLFWGWYRYIGHSWADTDNRYFWNFKSCFLLRYQKYAEFYTLPFSQKCKK